VKNMVLPNPLPQVEMEPHIETIVIAPGATTAATDTGIDLPSGTSPILYLLGARTVASTGSAYTTQELTVVTYAAPAGSNNIAVKDYNTVQVGNNTTNTTTLILTAICGEKGYSGAFNTLPNPYPYLEMEPHIETLTWRTAAVNADTAFDLPSVAPPIVKVLGGRLLSQTADVVTQTALTAVDYTTNPSAGEIAVVDYNSLICGTATTTSMLISLEVVTAPKGYTGAVNAALNPLPQVEMEPHIETIVMYTASAADTAFDFPASTPPVVGILNAKTHASSSGVLTEQALTVATYDTTMGATSIALKDYNSLICGTDFSGTKTRLMLTVVCAPKGYNGSIKT
jgi:hypothetical protein